MAETRPQRHAIIARDAAAARLRWLTAAALAVATGVAGLLAGVAASSTHHRAAARRILPAPHTTTVPPVPVPTATVPLAAVPQPSSAAPSSAPVPSYAQPVVVSGGS
jgi:hypothetical protein